MSLETRVSKLEGGTDIGRSVIVWKETHETAEQVIARWRAEHDGADLPDTAIIVGWSERTTDGGDLQ